MNPTNECGPCWTFRTQGLGRRCAAGCEEEGERETIILDQKEEISLEYADRMFEAICKLPPDERRELLG